MENAVLLGGRPQRGEGHHLDPRRGPRRWGIRRCRPARSHPGKTSSRRPQWWASHCVGHPLKLGVEARGQTPAGTTSKLAPHSPVLLPAAAEIAALAAFQREAVERHGGGLADLLDREAKLDHDRAGPRASRHRCRVARRVRRPVRERPRAGPVVRRGARSGVRARSTIGHARRTSGRFRRYRREQEALVAAQREIGPRLGELGRRERGADAVEVAIGLAHHRRCRRRR